MWSPVTEVFAKERIADGNVKLLLAHPFPRYSPSPASLSALRCPRCVYIAPMEALAKERFADWSVKFGEGLGVSVAELTGDTAADVRLLDKSNIVISTPERWDMLSRR